MKLGREWVDSLDLEEPGRRTDPVQRVIGIGASRHARPEPDAPLSNSYFALKPSRQPTPVHLTALGSVRTTPSRKEEASSTKSPVADSAPAIGADIRAETNRDENILKTVEGKTQTQHDVNPAMRTTAMESYKERAHSPSIEQDPQRRGGAPLCEKFQFIKSSPIKKVVMEKPTEVKLAQTWTKVESAIAENTKVGPTQDEVKHTPQDTVRTPSTGGINTTILTTQELTVALMNEFPGFSILQPWVIKEAVDFILQHALPASRPELSISKSINTKTDAVHHPKSSEKQPVKSGGIDLATVPPVPLKVDEDFVFGEGASNSRQQWVHTARGNDIKVTQADAKEVKTAEPTKIAEVYKPITRPRLRPENQQASTVGKVSERGLNAYNNACEDDVVPACQALPDWSSQTSRRILPPPGERDEDESIW
jgi:hypothetical protein